MSDSYDYLSTRPLKELGSKAIEEAIRKAICELAGDEYDSNLVSIDFEPSSIFNPQLKDCVEVSIRLQRNMDLYLLNNLESAPKRAHA